MHCQPTRRAPGTPTMRPASGQAGHLTHPHARGADRRHPAVWLVVVVAGVVVLVGCSPPGEGGRFRGGDGVVRVGLLRPVTGTVAASGKDMEDGWNLYWRQHGNVVAGKRVQTVAEDDAGNPPVGLNKASLLVERYRVQVVVGPLLANVGLAVAELLNRKKVPVVMPVVAADDLTQRTRYPYVLRFAGWTASQETHPLGEWAFSQGWRTAVTLCADYTFGYEACGGFVNTFTDRGGRVLKQLWNPLGTPDVGAYLAEVRRVGPDVVFAGQTARDVSQFWAYGPAASPRHPVYAKTYQGADRWAGPGGEGCPTPRDQPAPSHGMDMEVLDAAAAPRPAHP